MSDSTAEPISFCRHGLNRYLFGNRWTFAIECEMQDCDVDPWGSLEPFGSCWLWAGGSIVGNTDATEQLNQAFGRLKSVADNAGKRADSRFPGMRNEDKLDFVRWVQWGEDDEFRAKRWGNRSLDEARAEEVEPFWVVPPGHSPFFDDWEAILLEGETNETLVWRHWRKKPGECKEAEIASGTVAEVCRNAWNWFEPLRVARMGSTLKAHDPNERPKLVLRIY